MSLLYDASLIITPNAYKEGKLYALKPSNGNGDLTWSRATTATRVNSAGLIELAPYNLLTWSEQFDNAVWSTNNATKIATASPSGTLTAALIIPNTTNGEHNILNSSAPLAPRAVFETYSVYAKASGYNFIGLRININSSWQTAFFDLSNGTVASSPVAFESVVINAIGDGWYRCSVSYFNRTANGLQTIPTPSVSVTFPGDGVSGVSVWGAQLVEGTDALPYLKTETRLNIPRVDYSLGGCPSILLEPQRTNLLLRSEEFNDAYWTKTNATIGVGSIASPLGFGNAIIDNAVSGAHRVQRLISVTNGLTYTQSAFFKKASNEFGYLGTNSFSFWDFCFINLDTLQTILPSGVTANVVQFPNGWIRFSVTKVANSTASFNFVIGSSPSSTSAIYIGTGINSVYIDGAQLEQGAYPTSYIPTVASTVTRVADLFNRNNIFTNGLISASGGTWFVEIDNNLALVRDSGGNFGIGINTGVSTIAGNGFTLRNTSSGASRFVIVKITESINVSIFTTTTDKVKLAITWNGTTANVFVNGVKVVTDTAFTPTNMENLFSNAVDVPKYIKQMWLENVPMTDVQLIAATTL